MRCRNEFDEEFVADKLRNDAVARRRIPAEELGIDFVERRVVFAALQDDGVVDDVVDRSAASLDNADDLFTAALLQDMAVPMLARELNAEYTELLAARESGKRLSELEFERFGWTHGEAAALMANAWKLPEQFGRLLARHAHLDELLDDAAAEVGAKIVAVSSLLPAQRDTEWSEREIFLAAYQRIAGAAAPSLAELFAQIDASYEEFGSMLKLATPAKPLASFVA